MTRYRIAVIAGDGIGPEVTSEGIKVLEALQESFKYSIDFDFFPWGCEYYHEHQRMMDEDGLKKLSAFDAIYLGAVGDPSVPDHLSLWGLLLPIRKGFDQYVNLRPIKLLPGAPCPLKDQKPEDIDILFVRENTEGEYAGIGSFLNKGKEDEKTEQTSVFTRKGTERIFRYAFEEAKKKRKSLTAVTKSNALNYSMVYWDSLFQEVAKDYPNIETQLLHVDAMAMHMVKHPKMFDVVVASNLFGDILTDLGAALQGGMGFAAGGNINPKRDYPSMFEPIHGSAPDIKGKGLANPFAAIWAAAMMMSHLGEIQASKIMMKALRLTVAQKAVQTPDLGGIHSTREVGDEVVKNIAIVKDTA